jgi:hypothetical protein
MSMIAASQADIDLGTHAKLSDLHFLLTLDDSIVDPSEKKAAKDQLLEGIQKNGKGSFFSFFFQFPLSNFIFSFYLHSHRPPTFVSRSQSFYFSYERFLSALC